MKVIYPESGTTTVGGTGDVSYKAGDVVITNSVNQPANSILATGQTVNGNNYPDLTALNNYTAVGNLSNITLDRSYTLGSDANDYAFEILEYNNDKFLIKSNSVGVNIYSLDDNSGLDLLIDSISYSTTPYNNEKNFKKVVVNNNIALVIFEDPSGIRYFVFDMNTKIIISSLLNFPIDNADTTSIGVHYNQNINKFIAFDSANGINFYSSVDGISWSNELTTVNSEVLFFINDKNYYNGKYYFSQVSIGSSYKIISFDENTFTETEEFDFTSLVDSTTYTLKLYNNIQFNDSGEAILIFSQNTVYTSWEVLTFDGINWNYKTQSNLTGLKLEYFELLSGKTIALSDRGAYIGNDNKVYISYDFLETAVLQEIIDYNFFTFASKIYLNNDYLHVIGYNLFDEGSINDGYNLFTYDQAANIILPDLQPLSSGDGKTNGYLIHTN